MTRPARYNQAESEKREALKYAQMYADLTQETYVVYRGIDGRWRHGLARTEPAWVLRATDGAKWGEHSIRVDPIVA